MAILPRLRGPARVRADRSEQRPASTGDDLIVDARGVRKIYRGGDVPVEALRGVDFCVRRGEMVAIMGPSGCGKTTLLNCLSGIDAADGGVIVIDGRPLRGMSDAALTRYRATSMGFVFQSFNLLPVLTAAENVEYPLLVTGVAPREARRRALDALAAVGLAERAGHRPARLSGGQQQRVAVARAVVTDPAIVWADEPTGNLDSESADGLMDLLRGLNQRRGQTFVVVTHAREVGERADRIVRMRDGQITPS
jgi:putative ABC transport system ATP-binding protein